MDEEKNDKTENNQDNNLDKKMVDAAKDMGRKQAKMVGKAVKAVMGKIMVVLSGLLIKLIPLLVVATLLYTAVNWVLELIKTDNTSATIYELLEVENIADLIEIKGDEQKGYYLDFAEDTDKKLEDTVDKLQKRSGVQSFSDVEVLKKMIMAEVSSQFPNLGGEIPGNSDGFQGGIKIRRVTPNKELGEMKNTGAGEVVSSEKLGTTINEVQEPGEGETVYTVGIMAAHSTDSPGGRSPEEEETELKAEDMTVLVSRYVQRLLSIYGNINVLELGSTVENPNVPDAGRLQAAVDANVDILIEIDFATSGDGKRLNGNNGITAVYNEKGSSRESHKLGSLLRKNVANKMNLRNDESDYKEPKETIGTEDNTFPSVEIRGGYLTGKKDYQILSEEESLIDYARGIADGILEYFVITNKGYGTVTLSEETITKTVNSRVYDLKYVPEDKFNEYIQNNDRKALSVYTLGEDNTKLLTARWKAEGSTITIEKNTTIDYRKSMEMYTMPYEYLIAMLIDTKSESFVEGLADMAIKSEYIIAVQDKVTTKETTVETYESTDGGEQVMISQDGPKLTETVSSSVGLTYADAWFVKFYCDASFSTEYLNTLLKNTQVDRDNLINIEVKLNGSVSETSPDPTWSQKGSRNETEYKDDGRVVHHTIVKTVATRTHSISNTYSTGSKHTEGKEYDFIKLYKNDKEAPSRIKPTWLFTILGRNEKTKNMVDLTKYLLYKATGYSFGVKTFDFSAYDPTAFQSANSGGVGIPLYTPVLSKENFVAAMQEYGSKLGGYGFNQNFLPYAEEIYDVSVEANVNPELVIVTACAEQSFVAPGNAPNNYWGIAVYTQSSVGKGYATLFDGVRAYAELMNDYNYGGSHESGIMAIYERRKDSGCDPLGYGLPGTFTGMQSQYSATDGTSHWQGKSEYGNYLLNCVYGGSVEDYTEKCLNGGPEHADSAVFTPWESGEYTAWQVRQKIEIWNDIFGAYGTLSSGGTGSAYSEQGDGYSQLYTNSHGRTFKEYRMNAGSYEWNSLYLYPSCTIHSHGCAVTTVAILASGYGMNVNPEDVNYAQGHGYGSVGATLMPHFLPDGVNTTGPSKYMDIDTVRNHLLNGGTAYFYAQGGIFAPGSQHYMAILDISSDGSQIYLSDPWQGAANSGWIDINLLYNNGGAAPEFSLII